MRSPVGIIVIAVVLLAAVGTSLFILIRRLLGLFGADLKKKRWILIDLLCIAGLLYFCMNLWSLGALLVLHTAAAFMLLELIAAGGRIFCKKTGRQPWRALVFLHQSGLGAVLLAALVLLYGYVNMAHYTRTEYQLTSEKLSSPCRVVLISDTHYGTIQSKGLLQSAVEEISGLQPDMVILDGDIVEEQTSKADMEEVFALFGTIPTKYGVFYIYGNHDRQPHARQKAYSETELEDAILAAGIQILEDSAVELGDELLLVGRGDARWGNSAPRMSAAQLLEDVDLSRFAILADHQPIDAEAVSAAGVDLMVSGHTHAGQIWPVGLFTTATGGLNYGRYQFDQCTVLVSSGFTGWGYPIRTQGQCEYVVINMTPGS